MELAGRREVFCREYLKDLNASAAATRAGYSPDRAPVTGCELLATEEVQRRISELAAARNERFEVQAVEVLRDLYHIAHLDPIGAVDEHGAVKSLHEIPADLRKTISSIEVDTVGSGVVQRTKVKFWNKNDALNSLAKHLGLLKDIVEHRIEGGVVIADAEAAAKIAAILEDARRRHQDGSDLV